MLPDPATVTEEQFSAVRDWSAKFCARCDTLISKLRWIWATSLAASAALALPSLFWHWSMLPSAIMSLTSLVAILLRGVALRVLSRHLNEVIAWLERVSLVRCPRHDSEAVH
jgi:hypothetical protein